MRGAKNGARYALWASRGLVTRHRAWPCGPHRPLPGMGPGPLALFLDDIDFLNSLEFLYLQKIIVFIGSFFVLSDSFSALPPSYCNLQNNRKMGI